jgi:ADP-heptose:LPS heptosyltransferase
VTGQVRELQRTDPRRVRIVYERPRWHEAWENNPRIALPGEVGEFQELHPRHEYLRPYMVRKTPERWTWKRYGPPRGELYFTPEERGFGERHAGRIVFEPCCKPGASPNKDWGWERWRELVELARARGMALTQLGPASVRRMAGVEHIETSSMRKAAAVMAHAVAAVLPEGGLHHVAAAVGTPAVVIYGGFISPEVTGYLGQRSLFVATDGHPIGCGWRVKCEHCDAAMASISPERVLNELEKLLEESRRRVAA